jgi:hypothetical protein
VSGGVRCRGGLSGIRMDPLGRARGCGRWEAGRSERCDNSNQMRQCEAIFPPPKPLHLLSLEISLWRRADSNGSEQRHAVGSAGRSPSGGLRRRSDQCTPRRAHCASSCHRVQPSDASSSERSWLLVTMDEGRRRPLPKRTAEKRNGQTGGCRSSARSQWSTAGATNARGTTRLGKCEPLSVLPPQRSPHTALPSV